ncbi:FAD:protein FMN transferase [Streptomyces nigra]|uniref:FAD:protein FMN transferase n=1 Tax=Streptomyces TaxID=1883 RepID=UPI00369D4368
MPDSPRAGRTPGPRHVERAMGTVFSFDLRDPPTPDIRHALDRAVTWLHRVDEVFSTYRPGSQISRLARGEVTLADCDRDVTEVLRLCESAQRLTGGWFSPTPGGRLDRPAWSKAGPSSGRPRS